MKNKGSDDHSQLEIDESAKLMGAGAATQLCSATYSLRYASLLTSDYDPVKKTIAFQWKSQFSIPEALF